MGLSVHDPFVDALGNPLGLARSGADITPLGTITTRSGGPATNELPADGRSLLKASYSKLYSAIGDAYTSSILSTPGSGTSASAASSLVNLPSSSNWVDIAYGNGTFVIISLSFQTAISPDGENWIAGGNLPISGTKIAFGNGVFIAISNTSTNIAISVDGKSWRQVAAPMPYASSIAYGDGRFVVAGQITSGAGTVYSSYSADNGETWSAPVLLMNTVKALVCWGGGVFVAIDGSTQQQSRRSLNGGESWLNAGLMGQGCSDIAYGDGVFLAGGTASNSPIFRSLDFGQSWTINSTGSALKLSFAVDGFFLVVSTASTVVVYSKNGIYSGTVGDGLFINYTLPNSAIRNAGMAYGKGVIVFVTQGSATAAITKLLPPSNFSLPLIFSRDQIHAAYIKVA